MTSAIPLPRRIDVLLNTLRGERYFPRPLLAELIDALVAMGARAATVRAARVLHERLDRDISDGDRERLMAQVIESVRSSIGRADMPPSAAA